MSTIPVDNLAGKFVKVRNYRCFQVASKIRLIFRHNRMPLILIYIFFPHAQVHENIKYCNTLVIPVKRRAELLCLLSLNAEYIGCLPAQMLTAIHAQKLSRDPWCIQKIPKCSSDIRRFCPPSKHCALPLLGKMLR